uniref:hypothetical protein n=1 Tax=Cellvibrio fontiphilus TaxID=1815559 RepID=UPI002B4BAE47|nr:hypothetical protein [Cellvibrio fontiphilus]
MIREVYPQVAAVFLVRNPDGILASHQKLPGRHMAGDAVLVSNYSQLAPSSEEDVVLDLRIRVLVALLSAMDNFYDER